jgi:hypothetical protein
MFNISMSCRVAIFLIFFILWEILGVNDMENALFEGSTDWRATRIHKYQSKRFLISKVRFILSFFFFLFSFLYFLFLLKFFFVEYYFLTNSLLTCYCLIGEAYLSLYVWCFICEDNMYVKNWSTRYIYIIL